MTGANKAAFGGFDREDMQALGIEDANHFEWTNEETAELPAENSFIEPFGWKILVMPMRPKAVSKGGILIPQVRQEQDQYLNYVGRVVALGPLAYKHSKYANMGMTEAHRYKRGDWVVYPVYQYQRIDFKGIKLVLMNDDSFLGRVPEGVSPWDFKLER